MTDRIQPPLVILLPVFDDWESLELLLAHISEVLEERGIEATAVVLDDASPRAWERGELDRSWGALAGVRVVALRRNLGHQRAIAIGLSHVYEHFPEATTVVMDADGEDDPADLPKLLDACRAHGGEKVIFAERTRRLESFSFQAFYHLYRWLHYLFTGIAVRVGNFSVVPWTCLERLVVVSELWSHYAAAVFRARIPRSSVPSARARRLAGRSKMRFVSLVIHGLTAISVFGDVVAVRLLIAGLAVLGLLAVGLGAIFLAPLGLEGPSGWTSLIPIFALFLALQILVSIFALTFIVLGGRQHTAFVPLRDYRFFIRATHDLR